MAVGEDVVLAALPCAADQAGTGFGFHRAARAWGSRSPPPPGAVGHRRAAPRVRHPRGRWRGVRGHHDLRFAGEGLAPGQGERRVRPLSVWRGRGLAPRAVLLASRYAASEGGTGAVIQVEPENPASAAVAQRAGFTPGRQTHSKHDTRFDRYVRDLRAATP
ncbi:GNAT family N-acetyltransferase [Streptomyces sp. NPDC050743]|uniref:GNAT family N-acetyltransferase n=1 Tax=Streptomyces sp. NPDC050743 TaxID=3365634 RepID=UPI0037B90792